MEIAGTVVALPVLIVFGVLVGFIAGMFGVGGGFLLTPLLGVVLDIPMPIAVGSGLCQMVGSSTVGALRYRKLGLGEPRFAVILIFGSFVGVGTGARAVQAMEGLGELEVFGTQVQASTLGLYGAFFVFLTSVAAIMWRQSETGMDELDHVRRGPLARLRIPPYVDLPSVSLTDVSATVIAYTGLFIGFVSGLLGVGGGIALIPLLLYGYGFPFRAATGTGIVVTLLTATVGTIAHARAGHVHLGLAMVVLAGSGISAQLGALATSHLSARTLRKGLVGVILLTIAALILDTARKLTG